VAYRVTFMNARGTTLPAKLRGELLSRRGMTGVDFAVLHQAEGPIETPGLAGAPEDEPIIEQHVAHETPVRQIMTWRCSQNSLT
jgi:hypothetical protein